MSPNPISGKMDAGLHAKLQKEAEARNTSMLGLQRRLLNNLPLTPIDLFAQNDSLFKKGKK